MRKRNRYLGTRRPREDQIDIDDEVFAALEREKREGESINDVLRRKLEIPPAAKAKE